jgi:hypothetical protein
MDEKKLIEEVKKVMDEALEGIGELPIKLDITEAERIVLSQWIGKITGTTFSKGFEFGVKYAGKS